MIAKPCGAIPLNTSSSVGDRLLTYMRFHDPIFKKTNELNFF
jgi:hypothetical protein